MSGFFQVVQLAYKGSVTNGATTSRFKTNPKHSRQAVVAYATNSNEMLIIQWLVCIGSWWVHCFDRLSSYGFTSTVPSSNYSVYTDSVNPLAAVWIYHCQTTLRETHSFSRLFPRDSLKATLSFCLRLLRVLKVQDCPMGLTESE